MRWLAGAIALAGVVVAVAGVWMLSEAAALIVSGVAAVAFGLIVNTEREPR